MVKVYCIVKGKMKQINQERSSFNVGEISPKLKEEISMEGINQKSKFIIDCRYNSDSDILELHIWKLFLQEKGFNNISCYLPYFPYGRADRKVDNKIYSLKYISEYINSMNFTKIYTVAPHSKKIEELVKNLVVLDLKNIFLTSILKKENLEKEKIVCVFPDKGSLERFGLDFLEENKISYLIFNKKRNTVDENIESIKLTQKKSFEANMTYVIFDDICGKGSTAKAVASIIKEKYDSDRIILAVFHCENKALNKEYNIFDYIDVIYTLATCYTMKNDNVVVLNDDINKLKKEFF